MTKTAVILFNLGGPDTQQAVKPFLFNLFKDPAIIRLPAFLRLPIAKLISSRRAPVARDIYMKLGGGSPILANTVAQADALDAVLNDGGADIYKSFIAMRYWHPFASHAAREVKIFDPDSLILLPLYPQFSTTTTASSFADWRQAARAAELDVPTRAVCCYPQQAGFIRALAKAVRDAYRQAEKFGKPRLLFSAHGLPQKIIDGGDPYRLHCEATVEALRRQLDIPDLDSVLCFQSRVGPMKWIKPATDEEIERAGQDKVPLVVAPVAFVSDHSETLVEIDIEYRALAEKCGVPHFGFVPAVGTAPLFIEGLAQLVRRCAAAKKDCLPGGDARLCPQGNPACPCPPS